MNVTVFFPRSYAWEAATEWVAGRYLPVTIIQCQSGGWQGDAFPRFCDEIDKTNEGQVFYTRNLEMRAKR